MPVTARTGNPSVIDPDTLYSLPGFIEASGISYSSIRSFARDGVEIPTFKVGGRRKFIKGVDAIAYIDQLAAVGRSPNRDDHVLAPVVERRAKR
jgi:hypothetical protein